MESSRLFSPLRVGNDKLEHRIVMAPLTRFRADDKHTQIELAKRYYCQRASVPGTLLITEATFISPRASGYDNVPGIWNFDQVAAWKKVTDAVHDRKCLIYVQLWAPGNRAAPEKLQRAEGGPYPVVAPSAIPLKPIEDGGCIPHALSVEEIKYFVDDYATAANNAMAAGFDGVELHGANGYLIDQFLQDVCNQRTDEYGGCVENRSRFGIEVTKAVINAVGDSKKVAIRLSPWTGFEGKQMENPVPQFLHIISELKKLDLAYLHLVESRRSGDVASAVYHALSTRNDPFIEAWGVEDPIILAGGFTPETAKQMVDEVHPQSNICIAFGRHYISTPDLPFRIREGLALNPYDRSTFYKKMSADGYIDYSFSPEYQARMTIRSAA